MELPKEKNGTEKPPLKKTYRTIPFARHLARSRISKEATMKTELKMKTKLKHRP